MSDRNMHADEQRALPQPTIWPAALAAGVTLFGAGLLTNFVIAGFGVILFILALRGWIRELLAEERPEASSVARGHDN